MTNTKQKLQLIALIVTSVPIVFIIVYVAWVMWFNATHPNTPNQPTTVPASQEAFIPPIPYGSMQSYLIVNDAPDVELYLYRDPAVDFPSETATTEQLEAAGFIADPFGASVECKFNESTTASTKVNLFRSKTATGITGGGYSRDAYVCGDQYIVFQFDGAGPQYVGPFELQYTN